MGDFIQNYTPGTNVVRNWFFKAAGVDGSTPVDARASFIGKKAAGRASLERLLTWEFDKLIVAHGQCVDHGARDFVRRAFSWLSPVTRADAALGSSNHYA